MNVFPLYMHISNAAAELPQLVPAFIFRFRVEQTFCGDLYCISVQASKVSP